MNHYRADIDGLRALAVLAVIAFHARPALLPGGYAGVDLFFVISGFLITNLISKELALGAFSLAGFYNRRIKRILPAYIVVALATLLAAAYLLIPNDYVFYTTSLAASWAFASNVFFSLLSWGYFGQRTEEFPLLHTWSLSVEEQFYFVYPLLLLGLHRYFPRWRNAALLALAVALLALSELKAAKVGAYFLLPYRAHELLAGALAACAARRVPGGAAATAQALAGLVLALGSLVLLHRQSPYPGLHSLPPALGAALLIHAGGRANAVSSLLGSRPLAAIGKISYSLYLWHWPIFSFLRYRGIALDTVNTGLAIAASFALAYLSWRYIEMPARRQSRLPLRVTLPMYYALPAAVFLAVGLHSYATEGAPGRFSSAERQLIASYSFERDLTGACAIRSGEYRGVTLEHLQTHCTVGAGAEPPRLLLFGDSHANHFKPFLAQLALAGHLRMAYFVEGSCSPIDLHDGGNTAPTPCQRRNADLLALASHFHYVALAGLWQYQGRETQFSRELDAAMGRITAAGAIPVVFKDNPAIAKDLSRCVLHRRRGWLSADTDCDIARPLVDAAQGSMDRVIDMLQQRYPQAIVIDPKRVMCDHRVCATAIGDTALYKDANHINLKASELLAQRYLVQEGNPLLAQTPPQHTMSGAQ
jgi:peptidoglycan/LPS O-acetylase OafA/YrhL